MGQGTVPCPTLTLRDEVADRVIGVGRLCPICVGHGHNAVESVVAVARHAAGH